MAEARCVVIVNDDHEGRDCADLAMGAATKSVGSKFPRARRLLSPAQFSAVLSGPIAVRAGAFALYVVERTTPGEVPAMERESAPTWRLGLVIPKRFVASAAHRNSIKRRWREAFRLHAASLEAQFPPSDLVVRMNAGLAATKQPRVPKQRAAKRRPTRQGSAIQAIDATLLIDRMVARLSSKPLANRSLR